MTVTPSRVRLEAAIAAVVEEAERRCPGIRADLYGLVHAILRDAEIPLGASSEQIAGALEETAKHLRAKQEANRCRTT